jgi:hypothetical protein
MFNKSLIKLPFFLVIFFALIWFKSYISLDPDFGWRLVTGFKILSSGIPRIDIYSYTMPSFPWVDHAWLNDVIFAFLYSNVGYLGLSFFTSLLTIASIYLSFMATRPLAASILNKNRGIVDKQLLLVAMPIVILVCTSILKFSGVRAQTWTWFFLAWLLNIIFSESFWLKYKKFIPLFFLTWANFHGGFAAGLLILTIFVLSRSVEKKKVIFNELFIVFASFIATLLNPYVLGIYREVWSSISDKDLQNRVMEWNLFFKSFNLAPMFLMIISGIFVYMYRSRLGLGIVLMFLLFLYETISSIRQVPLFSLFVLPIGATGILLFFNKISSDKESVRRFNKLFKYFLGFTLFIFVVEAVISIKASCSLSENDFYPKSAITYLKNNVPNGNLFSEYGWGGYVIWKFPEKKVFIDGRMPSWKIDKYPVNETGDAMQEYVKVISGDIPYGDIFNRYNIDTILWPRKKEEGYVDKIEEKYFDQLSLFYKILGKKQSNFNFLDELENDGWKIVYSDNVSVVLQK